MTHTVDSIMALATEYADVSFNQGLNRVKIDPEPEIARAALLTAVQEFAAERVGEPVAWYDAEMDSAYTRSELDGGTAEGLAPLYAAALQGEHNATA